jgi:hypothetical protein
MAFQFHDLVQDLAIARASADAPLDPDEVDAFEARTFRRRIAGLLWFPSAVGVLFLAGWANSVILGVAGFAVLVVALGLYAERGDRVAARIRRIRS